MRDKRGTAPAERLASQHAGAGEPDEDRESAVEFVSATDALGPEERVCLAG